MTTNEILKIAINWTLKGAMKKMTSPDEDKLEEITAVFIKALIQNKFDDENCYVELAKRLAGLIDQEIKWRLNRDEQQLLMQAWKPYTN